MKKLILLISIAFVGCGKAHIERQKKVLPDRVSILKVRDCEYVFWNNYEGSDMEHYAGCQNPAHK